MTIFLYANGASQKCTASREDSKFTGAEKGGAGRLSRAAVMGKVYKFASKVMSVKNTAIAFIKKHPKSITTAIGITTLLVGVSIANPALMSTGIATVVSAIIYIPPPMTSEQGDIAASIKNKRNITE
ncbi:hypothetical protein [Sodalis praecaptivus]|uniref:hypothetical protein n=1 Tax=Sodalis TaxID=84565 RepID=UPI0011DD5E7D|nr:hypothetical protein [Sodalis praecaptivus]